MNAINGMRARALGPGKYADGQGLWLVKRDQKRGRWFLRVMVAGMRREMGLGRWPDVSIAEARERAASARRQVRDGIDPIEARAKLKYQPQGRMTVSKAILSCFAAKQAELKGNGNAGRWLSAVKVHVIPKIGQRAIEDLDQHMLKAILAPLWHEKPETARKALSRINLTLQHAAALGLEVDLQAPMKARALLGKQRHSVNHIPALPYPETPSFYKMLARERYQSASALRFLILTAARTSEVRFATFDEIDGDVWIIPAERTKTSHEHRIPLVNEAVKIINDARWSEDQQLLFPSPTGKALSDATMSRMMQRKGYEARPHGFRATFRTWVEEQTDAEYEVKESALGHVVGSRAERAYQRSDRLEKRRKLMAQWERFLLSARNGKY